jgi:hypothetical protein
MFQSVLFYVAMVGIFSPAYALTEQELKAKLESAGYSQIRDVKSTAEGTVVKAMKTAKKYPSLSTAAVNTKSGRKLEILQSTSRS